MAFETSPVRMLSSVMTTAKDEVEFVLDDDEMSGGWVGDKCFRKFQYCDFPFEQ